MGRSIGYPSDATFTVYTQFHGDDEDLHAVLWDEFIDGLQEAVIGRYPSFDREDEWHDREGHIILENGHGQIIVYEYCGGVSISLVPIERNDGYFQHANTIHKAWCEQVEKNMRNLLNDHYELWGKVGSMSNGEGVFTRINEPSPGAV